MVSGSKIVLCMVAPGDKPDRTMANLMLPERAGTSGKFNVFSRTVPPDMIFNWTVLPLTIPLALKLIIPEVRV
jgi:hypothetical protein